MKNQCIFCGRELTIMQKKKLYCGNTSQTLCGDCYGQYKSLSAVERAEAAYGTGRADDAAKLREYLETVRQAQLQRDEEKKTKARKRVSEKKCLRCNEQMLDYGAVTFKLGEETYFFSDLNRLFSGSLTMNILRCASCGKVEFFVPDATELETLIEV